MIYWSNVNSICFVRITNQQTDQLTDMISYIRPVPHRAPPTRVSIKCTNFIVVVIQYFFDSSILIVDHRDSGIHRQRKTGLPNILPALHLQKIFRRELQRVRYADCSLLRYFESIFSFQSQFLSFILSNAYSHFNSGSICNIDLVKIGAEAEGIFEAGVNDIKELDLDGHGTDI